MIRVGKQHMVILHADDFMSSHVDPKFNDDFNEGTNCNDGKHREVNYSKGNFTHVPYNEP